MINVGIIGATGYTGEELIGILLSHPQVRIVYLAAKIDKPTHIAEIFPKFRNRIDVVCKPPVDEPSAMSGCDLFFLALPHTVSMNVASKLVRAKKRVIDLSADYRLRDVKIYEKFYKSKHTDIQNLKDAVYGLPEIYRPKIKQARLVANPGCYPTAAILGLAPLVACQDPGVIQEGIIIDAKTGVTGAGRRAYLEYSFSELNEDAYAYKINAHQHTPEITQELSKLAGRTIKITFVPHLLSINRGILETIYVKLDRQKSSAAAGPRHRRKKINPSGVDGKSFQGFKSQKMIELYKNFYKREPFVRVKNEGDSVRLKDVVHTNFCDIAIQSFPEQNLLIIITAVDNLIKGAAGQAVQNMNIMYGFPERTALV